MYERTGDHIDHFTPPEKAAICFTTKLGDPVSPDNSPQADPTALQTSFEQNLQDEHAKAIWNASIEFLRNSLKVKFDESKGFNDGNIFESDIEHKDSITEQEGLLQILDKNLALSEEQKNIFTKLVKKSNHLKKLLQQIYHMFSQQIFQELTILISECVSHYLLYKETMKLSSEITKFLGPAYTNLDLTDLKNKAPADYYQFSTESQISNKAEEIGDEIASSFFISTKIRFLNLKQVDVTLNSSNKIRRQFEKFVEVITKAVFLCAEGCFQHPNEGVLHFGTIQDASFTDNSPVLFYAEQSGRKRRNE